MLTRQQASRKGPAVTVRFRSKQELTKIRRAAKKEDLSLNTFVVGRASVAADEILEASKVLENPLAPSEKTLALNQ